MILSFPDFFPSFINLNILQVINIYLNLKFGNVETIIRFSHSYEAKLYSKKSLVQFAELKNYTPDYEAILLLVLSSSGNAKSDFSYL